MNRPGRAAAGARKWREGKRDPASELDADTLGKYSTRPTFPIRLIIRTSGEQRLSNF